MLAQTGITINEKNTAVVAPASAVYERNNRFTGSADGKLTITASKDAIPDSYAAFWGNAQGKLADYTSFPLIKAAGEVTTYTICLLYTSPLPEQSGGCQSPDPKHAGSAVEGSRFRHCLGLPERYARLLPL